MLFLFGDDSRFAGKGGSGPRDGEITVASLSGPEGRRHISHPWVASRLAECLDHLKGEIRKHHGRSLPQDIKVPRREPYWL